MMRKRGKKDVAKGILIQSFPNQTEVNIPEGKTRENTMYPVRFAGLLSLFQTSFVFPGSNYLLHDITGWEFQRWWLGICLFLPSFCWATATLGPRLAFHCPLVHPFSAPIPFYLPTVVRIRFEVSLS
jgi:hypothetical protein